MQYIIPYLQARGFSVSRDNLVTWCVRQDEKKHKLDDDDDNDDNNNNNNNNNKFRLNKHTLATINVKHAPRKL